jgi:hypothetical protein
MVITSSASLHASAAEAARAPPSSASRPADAAFTSKPATAWPALTRFCAIGSPILPSPIKPIFAIAFLPDFVYCPLMSSRIAAAQVHAGCSRAAISASHKYMPSSSTSITTTQKFPP